MDMQKIMQQAQEMQRRMQDLQEQLTNTVFEGSSAGGLVVVKINGRGNMIEPPFISPKLFETYPEINQDPKILADLIMAGHNNAISKRDEESTDQFNSMMGNMGMPADFKLPGA